MKSFLRDLATGAAVGFARSVGAPDCDPLPVRSFNIGIYRSQSNIPASQPTEQVDFGAEFDVAAGMSHQQAPVFSQRLRASNVVAPSNSLAWFLLVALVVIFLGVILLGVTLMLLTRPLAS